MGIFLGLMAACFWGLADFFAARVSRASGAYRTLFYAQLIGWSALSLLLLSQGRLPAATLEIWLLAGLLGLLNVVGSLAFYRALQIGIVSLVSPIASSFAAVTMILALIGGERPGAIQLAGLVLTLISVVSIGCLSQGASAGSREMSRAATGLGLAVLAALCFGFAMWLFDWTVPTLGTLWPTWIVRLVAILLLGTFAPVFRQSLDLLAKPLWPMLLAIGLIDTSAFLAYSFAITTTFTSVAAVLSSVFSVFTVVLAQLLLRERLHPAQWLALVGLFSGVGLVSLPH
jgi:drug/metabolite transporter (DMT)-like permease